MKDFWVFGYGSLMWRPGFAFAERRTAHLDGLNRRMCVYSFVHRGTPERPGLVMGLDHGGHCLGAAYRVRPEDWPHTLDYLRAREQVTSVYREIHHVVHLDGEEGEPVEALLYEADPAHVQYAGALTLDDQVLHVVQGQGVSGSCRDYLFQTCDHLREVGIHDAHLEALEARVRAALTAAFR
jgi:cation transport protein ChaC